jgi:hypothetical protein
LAFTVGRFRVPRKLLTWVAPTPIWCIAELEKKIPVVINNISVSQIYQSKGFDFVIFPQTGENL